jgi:SAM-dependent methyltransferase
MRQIGERLLSALSRSPSEPDVHLTGEKMGIEDALDPLCRVVPDFLEWIAGKHVLDFGSGNGLQALAMARNGAERVVGVDNNPKALQRARQLARNLDLENRVTFVAELGSALHQQFDLVISQNSMEHFADPEGVLELMQQAMRPGGKLLITFGPPWYAPYGSHMQFFCRVPWLNLVFSEQTVMSVRSRYRDDGAMRYSEVEAGLNQMTVRRFERILAGSGLHVEQLRYDCVKGIAALNRIPLARELFVNHITCVLTHRRPAQH